MQAVPRCQRVMTPQAPSLYVFDCGRIRLASVEAFNLKETDTDVRELSAPCYVVDHPKGQLLWDAGLPSELAAERWLGSAGRWCRQYP
jgi:N-acyl homoserine lactone hydrolase